jgi:integrase
MATAQLQPITNHAIIPIAKSFRADRRTMSRRKGQSGYVRQKGHQWYGEFYVDEAAGRTRRAVILGEVAAMTKSEARVALREHIRNLGLNTAEHLDRATQPVVLFSTKAELWMNAMEDEMGMYGRLKPSTYRTISSQVNAHLLPRLKNLNVVDIGEKEVDGIISDLATKGRSKSVIKSTLLGLSMILGRKFDSRAKLRALKSLKPKKSRDLLWFTAEEMKKIVTASAGRYRVLFATAAGTGCRAGELYGLRVEDINLDRGFITVRRSVWEGMEQSPKSANAYRTVGIDKSLVRLLREWIGDRMTGLLFPSQIGTPLRNNAVLEFGLHPVLKSLGIPRRGMHAFRHGRVSMLVEAGVPIGTIKAWIGHGSEKMVEQYTHYRPEYHADSLALVPSIAEGIDANHANFRNSENVVTAIESNCAVVAELADASA